MKARKRGAAGADIAVQRLDDNRYVLTVDGIVRYVGWATRRVEPAEGSHLWTKPARG